MQKRLLFLLLLCYTAILADCTHQPYLVYKSHPPVDSVIVCDTAVIAYRRDILPVLVNNCYICHSTDSIVARGSGFNIQDTASLRQYLAQDFRGDGIYGSKFFHCISHSPGALPMPPGYRLDSCSLNKIARWLHLGGIID